MRVAKDGGDSRRRLSLRRGQQVIVRAQGRRSLRYCPGAKSYDRADEQPVLSQLTRINLFERLPLIFSALYQCGEIGHGELQVSCPARNRHIASRPYQVYRVSELMTISD